MRHFSLKTSMALLVLSSCPLMAEEPSCSNVFIPREAAFLFEQGLIGRAGNRYIPSLLVDLYGDLIQDHDADNTGWLFRLETDVLDILRTAPEFRQPEYERLADTYHIGKDKAEYIAL